MTACGRATVSARTNSASLGVMSFPSQAWQVEIVLLRRVDGEIVARIRVAHHARGRIIPQHACNALRGGLGPVANNHDTGVLRESHADAAAVMQRHPGGARG